METSRSQLRHHRMEARVTTEPDEALLWATENSPDAYLHHAIAHGYRAGQAAAEARIKALEADVIVHSVLRKEAFDSAVGLRIEVEQAKVVKRWLEQRIGKLEGALQDIVDADQDEISDRAARALLKEADQ